MAILKPPNGSQLRSWPTSLARIHCFAPKTWMMFTEIFASVTGV